MYTSKQLSSEIETKISIIEALTAQYHTLSTESAQVDTLMATEQRQMPRHFLTHITDAAFNFFLAIEKECVQLLTQHRFATLGAAVLSDTTTQLERNATLYDLWLKAIISPHASYDVVETEDADIALEVGRHLNSIVQLVCAKPEEVFKELLHRYMQNDAPVDSTHLELSSGRDATYTILNVSAIASTSNAAVENPPASELIASFEVTRRDVEDEPEVVKDSLQEPELLDSVLPDTAVTFTLVEQGSQRARAKLVSSDGYEYTRKVSKGNFTYWRCSKRSNAINCPATVSQKGAQFKKNTRDHIHQADKAALNKVVIKKEVRTTCSVNVHYDA
ncbi:PREDICTED: uncharacterized protein LOC106815741 [Priapulus caudatus]|uniref:Uncharacterized protein LOC106815741 n=1 Tax=Priapulus caudatus TaxID=37621 RepID=A0ABM1EU65_PRICU|nr:PREDICTED: uncharacterized protein LOC106815741 [Priapulus caudatus]